MSGPHVLVMAKAPVPGRVKTRLCPPCTLVEAAHLAAAALADTLDAVAGCDAARRIVALDGEPGPWLPAGFDVISQRGDGFAARLGNAWADAGGPGIQIGMDTPQVQAGDLDRLLDVVAGGRAVLGPALDGGWWVIGLPSVRAGRIDAGGIDPAAVFDGIPMSTPVTGEHQRRRLHQLGLTIQLADPRRDVDTFEDLLAVAAEAPHTRTAALAARLELDDRREGVA